MSVIRVRESKHTRKTSETTELLRPDFRRRKRKRDLPRHPRGRSSAEDRPPVLQQRLPKRITYGDGSTRRRRLREADGISCSRISVNQVTMRRPRPSPIRCQAARNRRVEIAIALRRGGTRRVVPRYAFASLFTAGKGGNAATPWGFYRSHDRRHARFRRPTSPATPEGGRERRDDEGTILRHDVASHHLASPEIARRETPSFAQLVFPSLYSGLRDAANKFAWKRSGDRNAFSGRRLSAPRK